MTPLLNASGVVRRRLRSCSLTIWLTAAGLAGSFAPAVGAEAQPGAADLLGPQPLELVHPLSRSGNPPPPAAPKRELVLDRTHRQLRLLEEGKLLRRYPVAVGMPGWETPVGSFAVIEKAADPSWRHPANGTVIPPGPSNPLGSRWIGFHRDCRGRSGFNGQEHLEVKGCVTAGFHGTPNRESVGRAVSHGCVRLYDEHARELFDFVSLGTPVTVLP